MVLVSEVSDVLAQVSPKIVESISKLKNNSSIKEGSVTRFNYERFLGEIDNCVNLLIKHKAAEINASLVEKAL